MSMIKKLWQLQQTDSGIEDGKKRLAEILQAQKPTVSIMTLRQAVQALTDKVDRLETAYLTDEESLVEIDGVLDVDVNKLYSGKVKNPRELTDLQNRVDGLQKRKADVEEKLTDYLTAIESTQEKLDLLAGQLSFEEGEWEATCVALKEEQTHVALQVNDWIAQREAMHAKLDESARNSYDRLFRIKRGVAVSALRQGICQTCRVGVTNNLIREAQARKIVNCTSCGRMLYAAH